MTVFVNLIDLIGLFFLLAMVLVLLVLGTIKGWKQWRCKHENVFENGQCDAVCRSCHKNLGFIGTWRKNNPR